MLPSSIGAADTARYVKEINHPHVRMMYDTFHANIEEKKRGGGDQGVRSGHGACPHFRKRSFDTGEGHVDWIQPSRRSRTWPTDGWMVVEAFGLALPALAAATKIWPADVSLRGISSATRALRFMKSRWEG